MKGGSGGDERKKGFRLSEDSGHPALQRNPIPLTNSVQLKSENITYLCHGQL